MASVIKVTVENAGELLNAGAYGAGALIRIQSSATESGSFANLSGTGSTPTIALVDGTRIYTGYDPSGTTSLWYKVRYESSDGLRTSDYSAAFQTGGEAGGYICSLYDAKQRLFPPGHTDTTEDEAILGYIAQVSRFIENRTGRRFTPDPASGTTTYRFHTRDTSRCPYCGNPTLYIERGIRSVTTLGIATDDQPSSGGTYTSATSTAYYIDPPEADRPPGWPGTWLCFRSNATGAETAYYTASYGAEITGGFGFAAVPGDIEQVALNLVVAAHTARGVAGGDRYTVNIDGSRTFERALSYSDRMILDWYRVPGIA